MSTSIWRRIKVGIAAALFATAAAGIAASPAAAEAGTNVLRAGEVLSTGQSLISDGGQYRLAVQLDGNTVLYGPGNIALFSTRTQMNGPGGNLILQNDGHLVLYSPQGPTLWYTGVFPGPGAVLVMQSDGNLVEYAANGKAVWATNTSVPPPPQPVTGDTMRGGQTLYQGQSLVSGSGSYRAIMQSDGNFVVYGKVTWSTRTFGSPAFLAMQSDGNVVLYGPGGAKYNTRTVGNPGSRLVMQNDGNLVLYSAGNVPLWNSYGPGNTKDCKDFPSQAAAQNYYNAYFYDYGDIAQLDGDNDGVACQSYPY